MKHNQQTMITFLKYAKNTFHIPTNQQPLLQLLIFYLNYGVVVQQFLETKPISYIKLLFFVHCSKIN